MTDEKVEFSYSIFGSETVIVVSFIGEMESKERGNLEKCQQEVSSRDNFKAVIFCFAQVSFISNELIPTLAQMQKNIREKSAELRMCSMSIPIKEKLGKSGILRATEVSEDLKLAIYSLQSKVA